MLALPAAVLAIAVVVAAVRAGSGGSSGAAPSPTPSESSSASGSAADRLAAAFAAARDAGSVHLDLVQRGAGRTLRFSDDDGSDRGVQRITLSPDVRIEVRVIGSATYVRANAPGLVAQFQLPMSLATRLQGRWLLLRPGDPFYAGTTQGVTLDSTLHEYHLGGALTVLPQRTMDGVEVVGIRGTAEVIPTPTGSQPTATLWVRSRGTPLPVAWEADLAKGTLRVTFRDWGAPVDVTVPPHAERLAAVRAGSAHA